MQSSEHSKTEIMIQAGLVWNAYRARLSKGIGIQYENK